MNQLQKNNLKRIKRNKKKDLLRKKGKLYGQNKKTGRLKVRQRNHKLFVNMVCKEILKQKESETTESEFEKLPSDA